MPFGSFVRIVSAIVRQYVPGCVKLHAGETPYWPGAESRSAAWSSAVHTGAMVRTGGSWSQSTSDRLTVQPAPVASSSRYALSNATFDARSPLSCPGWDCVSNPSSVPPCAVYSAAGWSVP